MFLVSENSDIFIAYLKSNDMQLTHKFLALIFAGTTCLQAQYKNNFTTVENDPYKVLHYELDNGMKVYLSINRDEPRVFTNIAVRTGSKNDPSDATGLAHYLEHMLFKGTSKIGSLDWEKEKPLLEEISKQYELHRQTTDEEERKAIYAKIDSLSNEAAKFVATNEYDQMVTELGAKSTNAYTSAERTVYVNDIPSNELDKWMTIEAERFQELTLRLFHTELEAVYEEFNRAQDNDGRQVFYEILRTMYPNHTYGTQTTLGTGDDLKNPSMVKIHEYFNKYYVPNNMAIILVGDIDPDKSLALIKKHFGPLKKGPTPAQFQDPGQPEIIAPIKKEIKGTEAEYVSIAYRVGGVKTSDAMMVDLVSSILSNGEAGLIDNNLNNQQKVLRAYAYSYGLNDYSLLMMGATPREGQSLDEAQNLLLEQVTKLKNGDFDESLISSIVKNEKKSQMRQAESNGWKMRTLVDGFIFDRPWEYFSNYYDDMAKITKSEVVAWANKNIKDNYVSVHKTKGERSPLRLEKPAITAVQVNRGEQSEFRKKLEKKQSERLTPLFADFEKDIKRSDAYANLEVSYIKNTTNELFELNYIFDMGSRNDKELALAVQYLPYIGTEKYTVDELKRKFYDLGLDYSVYAGDNRLYITLSGLNESLEEGAKLFEEFLATAKGDEESYKKYVDGILKKRKDAKLSKYQIMYSALYDYAVYGEESPATDILSESELRALKPSALTEKVKTLKDYKHEVFYYGPSSQEDVVDLVRKTHPVRIELKDYPERKKYAYRESDKNVVYFVDYDQVQMELLMLSRSENFNKTNLAPANLFNQYFGSGLSSIIFQEIRESKALAYSAYSVYTSPRRSDEPHFVRAYIATQSDKLGDAVTAMQDLMNTMPREEAQFEQSRLGTLKQIETNRTTKSSIYWSYRRTNDLGLEKNFEPEIYSYLNNMDMDDMQAFFDSHIKDKKYAYLVIGKKDLADMEALSKLGEVKIMSLEEIFGY